MFNAWIFAAGVAVLMAFVSFTTARSGLLLRTWTPPTNLMLSVPDNLVRLGLLVLCLLLGLTVGPGTVALGWTTTHLAQDVALGAVVGLLLATALNIGGKLAVKRWGTEVYSTKLLQCILPINSREWAVVLLALLPAAGLEELLFRSLPLGGLGWLVSPWWLLWPLAVLFGLLHWSQGGWGVAGTTLAALALSLLFLATNSVWAVLTAHYVLNIHQLVSAKSSGMKPLRGPK